jgi:hypothetical protein
MSETPPIPLTEIHKITKESLKPEIPQPDGTVIVLQCNTRDLRDLNLPPEQMGALKPEAAQETRADAKQFFDQIFKFLTPEERKQVDILVVAADTRLDTPTPGITSYRQRAVETGEQVLAGIGEAMSEYQLDQSQLLNKPRQGDDGEINPPAPIVLSSGRMRDLKMFEESPEYVQYLKDTHMADPSKGEKAFWANYEIDDDPDKKIREEMGAEGPEEIADRVAAYMKTVANAMSSYHEKHPGRRAIVWAIGHYDNISPYLKRKVLGVAKDEFLGVDKGSGVVFNIGKDGKTSTQIEGHRLAVDLNPKAKNNMNDEAKEIPKEEIPADSGPGKATEELGISNPFEKLAAEGLILASKARDPKLDMIAQQFAELLHTTSYYNTDTGQMKILRKQAELKTYIKAVQENLRSIEDTGGFKDEFGWNYNLSSPAISSWPAKGKWGITIASEYRLIMGRFSPEFIDPRNSSFFQPDADSPKPYQLAGNLLIKAAAIEKLKAEQKTQQDMGQRDEIVDYYDQNSLRASYDLFFHQYNSYWAYGFSLYSDSQDEAKALWREIASIAMPVAEKIKHPWLHKSEEDIPQPQENS